MPVVHPGEGPKRMPAMTVVVISPSGGLATQLASQLPAQRFEVVDVRPGSQVLKALRRTRPGIAVVDRIDDRPDAAQLEVALLKDRWPEVEIIALSSRSSETDALVIEQGVFYYTAAGAPGEVTRVIEAAEQAATSKRQRQA